MNSPVIVALDFPAAQSAMELVDKLDPQLCRLKIGKELFTRCGPDLVRQVQALGFEVFLDLKFHDIPNTVAAAVRSAAELGVWMLNVHASGGRRMMDAARQALSDMDEPPLLIAVTMLTSLDEQDLAEVGIAAKPREMVSLLAGLAADCAMDGVVCSAQESAMLRAQCPAEFALVTPGIRLAGDSAGDQRRVVTPVSAMAEGSDYLVIGRSITTAAEPEVVLRGILEDLGHEIS